MPKLRTGAIVPVKTFSKAKTRLNLSCEKTEDLCKIMLDEVLQTISKSDVIEKMNLPLRLVKNLVLLKFMMKKNKE